MRKQDYYPSADGLHLAKYISSSKAFQVCRSYDEALVLSPSSDAEMVLLIDRVIKQWQFTYYVVDVEAETKVKEPLSCLFCMYVKQHKLGCDLCPVRVYDPDLVCINYVVEWWRASTAKERKFAANAILRKLADIKTFYLAKEV